MNVTREDMPGRQIALTIELDADTVNAALDKAYRQMVNQVNVPGFRRGRAPRYILESYVGKETLTERAVRNILPDTVSDAIKEHDITAMDVGDVEIVDLDPVRVKVIIVQPPKVELGDYSGIRVEREQTEINEDDVEAVLLELRREGAPWEEPAEPRPIKEGDMVYVNLEGFTTQGPIEAAARDNFPTIVGLQRAGVPESVNTALVDMNVGDEKDITDTLPDDYPLEELRGLDATYHVSVLSMKQQNLPEVDEEFAKKMNYDDVPALREAIETNLKRRSTESAESNQIDSIIRQILDVAEVDVPDVMVTEELDSMLKNMEERLKESRINIKQYFTYNGITEAEWREANRARAHDMVVRRQVMSEFARREGISVDEDEVTGEINTILERLDDEQRQQAEKLFGDHDARHELEDRIFQQKLVERLVGIAEGKIEASASDASAGADSTDTADTGADTADTSSGEAAIQDDDEAGTAADLAEAGGAAELLGTEGVDLSSGNETGDAPAGGTPTTAPGVDDTGKSG